MPPQNQPPQQTVPDPQEQPPQTPQPTQPPVAVAAPALNLNSQELGKKIQNAGRSVLFAGCLLLLISVLGLLALGSLEADKRLMSGIYLLFVVIASIYWIIAGTTIMRNKQNPSTALATMKIALVSSAIVSLATILLSLMSGKLGLGVITIALTVYLAAAKSNIKKLANI